MRLHPNFYPPGPLDRLSQGPGELAHAAGQGDERRASSTGPRVAPRGDAGQHKAPVPALGLPQLGNDGVEAQFVDRGAVDAAEQRAGQPLDEDAPEPAAEERPNGNITVEPIARNDQVEARSSASLGARTCRSR